MKEYKAVQKCEVASIQCDRCGFTADLSEPEGRMEAEEFLTYKNTGGYRSVFGDGSRVSIDLCQRCINDTLGLFIRVE